MANRLAQSQSPYLRQHAENPVDWWEWGPEAFAEAERRDLPILLSVGYAACHWCHVMAHESFEDPAVAAFMNAHFVNIKVDREERPDVDALYIRATTAMTGQAGWPMTCVLTPDGEPFFAGTYFPPEPQHGLPSFSQILQALAEAWRTRREEIQASSQQIADYLAERTLTDPQDMGTTELDAAGEKLLAEADLINGGFGGAPKFPPPMVLEFLMRWASRTGNPKAHQVIDRTFDAMARGGLRDHLGGGFARYSVDASWQVPHFEKMLYDNALLLTGYLHWRRTLLQRGKQAQAAWAETVCLDTISFLLKDLRTEEGGFASSLDADSDGAEGTYYVWTPAQLRDVLGPDDATWAAELLRVTDEGTFEEGASTLQLLRDPDDADRWHSVRTRLAAARARRTPPARDDKIVAAWNGLVISALVEASVELNEPSWLEAAEQAGTLLWDLHRAETPEFRRTSMAGTASNHAAVLEDHALMAGAYQDLFLATGNQHWWDRASTLITRIAQHFTDAHGGWFDTADDAEKLLARPQDFQDNASPSGNSATLAALIRQAAVTGEAAHIESAIRRLGPLMTQAPRFAGWVLAWTETWRTGPVQVAVLGEPGGPLHQAAIAATAPGTVVGVSAEPNDLALFENRDRRDGRDTAYVCRQFVCQLPVTTIEELRTQLQRQRV